MIKVKVASIQKKIFEGEVSKLTVKGIDGVMTILPNHVPVVTLINHGYIQGPELEKIEIKKALVTINSNSTIDILVSEL